MPADGLEQKGLRHHQTHPIINAPPRLHFGRAGEGAAAAAIAEQRAACGGCRTHQALSQVTGEGDTRPKNLPRPRKIPGRGPGEGASKSLATTPGAPQAWLGKARTRVPTRRGSWGPQRGPQEKAGRQLIAGGRPTRDAKPKDKPWAQKGAWHKSAKPTSLAWWKGAG